MFTSQKWICIYSLKKNFFQFHFSRCETLTRMLCDNLPYILSSFNVWLAFTWHDQLDFFVTCHFSWSDNHLDDNIHYVLYASAKSIFSVYTCQQLIDLTWHSRAVQNSTNLVAIAVFMRIKWQIVLACLYVDLWVHR